MVHVDRTVLCVSQWNHWRDIVIYPWFLTTCKELGITKDWRSQVIILAFLHGLQEWWGQRFQVKQGTKTRMAMLKEMWRGEFGLSPFKDIRPFLDRLQENLNCQAVKKHEHWPNQSKGMEALLEDCEQPWGQGTVLTRHWPRASGEVRPGRWQGTGEETTKVLERQRTLHFSWAPPRHPSTDSAKAEWRQRRAYRRAGKMSRRLKNHSSSSGLRDTKKDQFSLTREPKARDTRTIKQEVIHNLDTRWYAYLLWQNGSKIQESTLFWLSQCTGMVFWWRKARHLEDRMLCLM